MRQHMPGTSTEPEVARRYAAGEGSIFDIAEDMGPREATTLDMLFDAQGFGARVRAMNAEVWTPAQENAIRALEDAE